MAIEQTHPIDAIDSLYEKTSSRLHSSYVDEKQESYRLQKMLIEANQKYTDSQFGKANMMTIAIVASILGLAFSSLDKDAPYSAFLKAIPDPIKTIGDFLVQLKSAETAQIEGARNLIQEKMKEQSLNKDHIYKTINNIDQAVEEAKRYMRKADAAFFN